MTNNTFRQFIEKPRNLLIADVLLALPFLVLPLLISLPYRVNIFLSWEGAYRLYIGQSAFTDFGLPMGFGYWIIPTLFFKLFGPTFMSLLYAQFFINLIGWAALRGILYNLKVKPLAITLTLVVYSLTYVVYNFWPWYNHCVVIYELIALYFVTGYSLSSKKWWYYGQLVLAGFFSFLTFYTKQDVGGMGFMICGFLLAYMGWLDKTIKPVLAYVAVFFVTALIFILPVADNGFFYWFNYGQPPHNSRVTLGQLLDVMFETRILEKVYVLLILIGVLFRVSSLKSFINDRNLFVSVVICCAMILQSLVTRVSSPQPTDHMNYFHIFGFVGAIMFLPWEKWDLKPVNVLLSLIFVAVVFSAGYWKYISNVFHVKGGPTAAAVAGQVTKPWVKSNLRTMKHVLVPEGTNEGVKRIMELPFAKDPNLKVLNLSELTFLAYEMGYTPMTDQPLWYHLNIGMFQKEVDVFKQRIKEGYYDLVLFEDVPDLDNFYPYEVRDELKKDYFFYDNFIAPRKLENSTIDVYVKPELATRYGLTPVSGPTTLVRE